MHELLLHSVKSYNGRARYFPDNTWLEEKGHDAANNIPAGSFNRKINNQLDNNAIGPGPARSLFFILNLQLSKTTFPQIFPRRNFAPVLFPAV